MLACLSIAYRVSLLSCILSYFILSPGNSGIPASLPPVSVEIYSVVFLSLIRIIQCNYWVLLAEASCAGRQVPALKYLQC